MRAPHARIIECQPQAEGTAAVRRLEAMTRLAEAKRVFRAFGFPRCPLTDAEITRCITLSVDPYSVGCDVDNGWSFEEALFANQVEQTQ